MPWPEQVQQATRSLENLRRSLHESFTERDAVIDLLALAVVCQEHLLVLGPPGTAKTGIVRRFTEALDAPMFSYLLTRFTEPTEIFGPLDLREFNEGRYRIRTEHMLPTASVAFLDEVFYGSSAILNALLTLIHERVIFNGSEMQRVPLISLIGASNDLPGDPTLRAFADRFMLRAVVKPVSDGRLETLLQYGWEFELDRMKEGKRAEQGKKRQRIALMTESQMRMLGGYLPEVDLDAVRPAYAQFVRELRAAGVQLSDRRIVKGLRLIAGAALTANRTKAEPPDFWPLRHIWTVPEEAEVYRKLVEHVGGYMDSSEVTQRKAEFILDDVCLLAGRITELQGQTAMGAHLMALGRLRREVQLQHSTDTELLKQVDMAIEQAMSKMHGGVMANV